jgi:hypothetical protein
MTDSHNFDKSENYHIEEDKEDPRDSGAKSKSITGSFTNTLRTNSIRESIKLK